ncbi:Senescence-associated gene 101, putative isoform 1 [Theobroma cacao]|uniref:Senescence-associated gene 101, putative isoform 1 n=1 Tax=Theobroma cacao TaxID=3641 RepID=A0A061ECD9_THECC|nr:Senescence-associated gene 101, putative isoform 1 [Theobroma cacao]
MNQLFSSGSEVASFVVSSGLLKLSWAKNLDCYGGVNLNEQHALGFSLRYKAYQEAKFNIIAFVTSPICTKSHLQEAELVSSTALRETFPFVEFLCSNGNSFSIHKAAITLFAAHMNELLQLKNQCGSSSKPLIITGHSLGGSVASLFTLWLLESLDVSAATRPLCLTFGSPALVGDKGFQQSISEHPVWTSCFLHVATSKDSIPRLFIPPHNLHTMGLTSQPYIYKPFGTFLLCFDMGCTCSDNPEAISELLVAMGMGGTRNEEQLVVDYGKIVEQLESWIIFEGISQFSDFMPNSLRAGTILQLEAIGLQKRQQQQQQNNDFDKLIEKLEKLEESCMLNKRKVFDPAKKLNDIKIKMALLEWYKKVSKAEEIGYYDCYKNQLSQRDRDIVRLKKFLTNYWKEFVAQTEKKPQKEGVRTRWLYAGTNYRRMIEPLDIAEYYKTGQKNYINNGRSDHYKKMEQWLEEAEKQSGFSINSKKQNVDVILTYDSCFWARVEEARICCRTLENADASITDRGSSRQNLMKFELYVMEQIKKSAVSSEIFLKDSSFMQWWKEYEKIIEPHHNLPLTDFMKNCKYHQYGSGCLALNWKI